MITCTTCGSFIAGRSFKKHKSSIKHITYEKLLVSTNNTSDIANINDVSYVDDNILVDNHSAVNEATEQIVITLHTITPISLLHLHLQQVIKVITRR